MKIEEEKKIAIFAGTTEGRLLAERLAGSKVRADVFVATEYGKRRSRRHRISMSMTGASMRTGWKICSGKNGTS